MFAADERYVETKGRLRGVRDDQRGLALRLQQSDMRGEGDEFRFTRRGREYVLFVTVNVTGKDHKGVVFHIEHGNLAQDGTGLLATLGRQWMLADVVACFKAYGTLIFGREESAVEVVVRSAAESSATLKDLLSAMVGLRKRYPQLLEEVYATFESGRALSNGQFATLVNSVRALNLRGRAAAYRVASDVLPHLLIALKGPFSRHAPNFVRRAMQRTLVALLFLLALLVWAIPSSVAFIGKVAAGQVRQQTQLDLLGELFGGAVALAAIGATFYTIAVLVRLGQRDRLLTYIRTGRKR